MLSVSNCSTRFRNLVYSALMIIWRARRISHAGRWFAILWIIILILILIQNFIGAINNKWKYISSRVFEYFVSCIYSFEIVRRARVVFGDYERDWRSTIAFDATRTNKQTKRAAAIKQSIKKPNSESNRTHTSHQRKHGLVWSWANTTNK